MSFILHVRRLLASFFLLSFHTCLAPRHLLSFPTRRSSDLENYKGLKRARIVTNCRSGLNTVNRSTPAANPRTSIHAGIDPLDRKSTRLNSSHVAISYAVFCLKKKKNDHTCMAVSGLTRLSN